MDHLHLMSVFSAVAEEQGFASAARRLNISPPAVTRAINQLEDYLGIKLFHRTTRWVRTTEAGHHYLEDVKRILTEVKAADEAATGIHTEPRGELRLTAPVLFGRLFVTPVITQYLEKNPQTTVSALFLDRLVNLLEEGIDVGVRIGELPDSSLRAIPVGRVRHVVCGSPEYLKQHGSPRTPEALLQHALIASMAGNFSIHWHFKGSNGEKALHIQPRLTVTTNDAAIAAAKSNCGITRVLSYQVSAEQDSGDLQILLEDFEPPALPVHIVHQQGRNLSAKTRCFIDLIVEQLRQQPCLQ